MIPHWRFLLSFIFDFDCYYYYFSFSSSVGVWMGPRQFRVAFRHASSLHLMRPARWKFSRGNLTMISVTHVIRGNAARQPPSGSAHEYPNTRMFLRFLAHGDFESGQCVCLPASVDNSCCRRHRRSGFGGVAFLVERRDSRSIIPTCWKINWAIFSRCHRLVAGERQTESESGRGREEICHRNGKRCQFSRFQPDSFRFRNPDRSCRNSRNATAGLEEGRGREGGRKEGRGGRRWVDVGRSQRNRFPTISTAPSSNFINFFKWLIKIDPIEVLVYWTAAASKFGQQLESRLQRSFFL